jgi:MFS family permease
LADEKLTLEHDPFAPLQIPVYRRYLAGNMLLLLGMQMQPAAIQWEIFSRTGSTQQLANTSLIQFLPVMLLSIPAGFLADRFSRPDVVRIAMMVMVVGSLLLSVASWYQWSLGWFYLALLLNGMARAAQQPSKASLLPHIVPRHLFAAAVTWNTGTFQIAAVAGPLLAAMVIAIRGPALVYLLEAVCACAFIALLWNLREPPDRVRSADAVSWRGLITGFRFVWTTRVILAAISLDLFAVLLGGATGLLSVYTQDIIPVDRQLGWVRAWGRPFGYEELDPQAIAFGLLWAAPALGAVTMSICLTMQRPMTRAGKTLLWSVAGFGVATIIFGLSRSFWLSFAMLFVTGLLDMVSVVVRQTLVQLRTPDEMRGRVQAINGIFIGASNQLGAYESAQVASLFQRPGDPAFGPTVSVVSGGIGTLIIVGLTAWLSPPLRRYRELHKLPDEE